MKKNTLIVLSITILILTISLLPTYGQQNVNVEIKPGVGLGNLVQLCDIFSPTQWGNNYTKKSLGNNCYLYNYPSYGLSISVNANNMVYFIHITNNIYQTKEGIGVGAKLSDTLTFYGKPYYADQTKDGGYIFCYNGIFFTAGSDKIIKEISISK